MSKEFKLYHREDTSLKTKFHQLMDLLVSNKSTSRLESIFLISISYLQIISGFFAKELSIFSSDGSPDSFLNSFKKIVRIRDLIDVNFSTFSIIIYLLFILQILFQIYFIYVIKHTNKFSQYTYNEMLINFSFKFYFYILFSPILDCSMNIFCKRSESSESTFECDSLQSNPALVIICIFIFIYSVFLTIMLSFYYNDSNLLSNCFYSRISCNFELYNTLNILIFTILLNLTAYLGSLIFLIYNVIFSLVMLRFFFIKYPYYDKITSFLIGMFHILYTWTSIFSIVFYFIKVNQKSILYFCGVIILILLFKNVKELLEDRIVYDTPYHKIGNTNYILTYINILQRMIHNVENNIEDKASLIGIIQMHCIECPLSDCLAKKKEKIDLYLPVTEEWSNRNLSEINDKVYLLNFITFVYYFYISQNFYSADMLLNLASYYLSIIGNFNKAFYYLRKTKDMKLSIQESFAYFRLHKLIQKSMTEKLKPSNEVCLNLQEMNITHYFKYEDLSQRFFDAVSYDVSLNLDFWKILRIHKEQYEKLDLNQVFAMTDKIRKTKLKIEKLWRKLFDTYNNFNEMFDLYENYIEQINDDNIVKRELDLLKNKLLIQNEQIGMNNQYNILFDKDTAIAIINADKGKEGLIEHVNQNVCLAFDYKEEELKGSFINILMPKCFDRPHRSFIKRQKSVAEKKIIDRNIPTYGKNKKNCLIPISARVKSFPIVGDSLYFAAMITLDNVDDAILLDSKFNIQGMSSRLMQRFGLNYNLFQDIDVPLYLISKNFLEHYKRNMNEIKIENKNQPERNSPFNKSIDPTLSLTINNNNQIKIYNDYIEDRMNINENSELEFEIKIPNFLKNYTSHDNTKENFAYYSVMRTLSQSDNDDVNNLNINSQDIILEKPREDEEDNNEEKKHLINDDENESEKRFSSKKINSNEEEKEFQNKINYYKNFFEKKNFDLLEKEIDKLTSETKETFRFLFTFNIYKYGENLVAYIARCIDNKEELDYSTSGENAKETKSIYKGNIDDKNNQVSNKKEYVFDRKKNITSMQTMNEVDDEDLNKMKEMMTNYYHIHLQDKTIYNTIANHHNEILQFSRIFGIKDLKMMLDEASSQSSSSGYNEDLMRKAKVEEVKSNILKNVSEFYIFKIIKFLFFGVIIITIIFSLLIIMTFQNISKDELEINDFTTMFYHNIFTIASLTSSLISMRSLYDLELKSNSDDKKPYLVFENLYENVSDDVVTSSIEYEFSNYFTFLSKYVTDNYKYLMDSNSYIEYNFTKFSPDSTKQLFWIEVDSGFNLNFEDDITDMIMIGYPLAYLRSLTFTNELIKSEFFTLNYARNLRKSTNQLPQNIMVKYHFLTKSTIDNVYNYIIPHGLVILNKINEIFFSYNTNHMKTVENILIIYSTIIFLLSSVYVILLYILNKSMQYTLEKVTRIDIIQIEDTIKAINNFNFYILNKFRGKENGEVQEIKFENKINRNQTKNSNFNGDDSKNDLSRKFIFSKKKSIKQLKVLNGTYLQIFIVFSMCSIFLITIFFQIYSLINNASSLLYVKSFMYGDLIKTGIDVLTTKCVMANCQINESINYDSNTNLDFEIRNKIYQQLKFYPELNEFYRNKYLLSICDTLFEGVDLTIQNEICLNDEYVKFANNTNSLLKTIQDSIFSINKEILLYQGIDLNIQKKLFESNYFEQIEYIYYNYVTRIPSVLDDVLSSSFSNYVNSIMKNSLLLIILFCILLILFSIFVTVGYIKKLIHLLSVARCILKIIPTNVVNKTPELVDWINKY